jgi:ADP-ribosylglycohydrolase
MTTNASAAWRSLQGLALSDSFGETWFFRPADQVEWLIGERLVPKRPWPWTDDTAMALSVYQVLTEHGEVRQDHLGEAVRGRLRR